MIFPTTLISKYGYRLMLQPFLEDLEKLETSSVKVVKQEAQFSTVKDSW